MTQEQKAKAYDEAYKKVAVRFGSNVADEIFPKESEDERIRKAIINVFASHKDYEVFFGVSVEDILAWLEAQCEQKLTDEDEPKFKVGDRIIDKSFPKNVFTVTEVINDGIAYVDEDGERFTKYYDEDDWDEYELVEQKPANKVEPKFKVGDWVVIKQ